MTHKGRELEPQAFERLCEHMTVAVARCSDEQILDLADSLHETLRRRRNVKAGPRRVAEARSWVG